MSRSSPQALALLGLRQPPERRAIPGGGAQSVAAILDRTLARDPERLALVGRSGRYSFGELDREADRAAHALAELGVREGDRVAACLPNDVDIAIAFLATQRLSALWVGVNRALAPPEKAYILRDCGARVLLAEPDVVAELEPHRRGEDALDALEHAVPVARDAGSDGWHARLAASPGDARPGGEIDPFAPAAIAYTSGTTGFPKGAVHSQHNLLLPGAVDHLSQRFGPGLRQGVVLPLTILNMIVLELLHAWYDGRACVCIDRIDAVGLAEWVREESVGILTAVPTVFHDLLTNPDVGSDDLASLVEPGMGGSNVPPEVIALYRERFGRPPRIGYGMTEAPTAVSWSDGSVPPAPGLCGRPVPQVEIEIVGDDGAALPLGEVGEICVRPARSGELAGVYTPMLGYWRRPDATDEALREGRYHSGDLGFFTADGNLMISGRRSELILRGGANVYPAEVERALEEQPGVEAAAVFGIGDARLGERVVAVVQRAGEAALVEEVLREALRERLARYKVPDSIRFTDALPRNAMGKIVKRELRRLFDA